VSRADLKKLQLLGELGDEDRDVVAAQLEDLRLEAGALLFDEGEPGDAAFFLVSGSIALTSSAAVEGERLAAGAALGALALVADGPRAARAKTTSRSSLLVLRRDAFQRLCDDDPRVGCRLLEALLRETVRLGRAALALPGAGVDPAADGH